MLYFTECHDLVSHAVLFRGVMTDQASLTMGRKYTGTGLNTSAGLALFPHTLCGSVRGPDLQSSK